MDEKKKQSQLHKDLKGFDVRINPFGQIESNFDIDKVNKFLNENMDDKRIKGQKAETTDVDDESE